jgi:hypothetical protein
VELSHQSMMGDELNAADLTPRGLRGDLVQRLG